MLTSENNAGGKKAGCERSFVIKHDISDRWNNTTLQDAEKQPLRINAPEHTKQQELLCQGWDLKDEFNPISQWKHYSCHVY